MITYIIIIKVTKFANIQFHQFYRSKLNSIYMYIFILKGMVYMCTRDAHVGLYRSIKYDEYLMNPHHHPPHLHQN